MFWNFKLYFLIVRLKYIQENYGKVNWDNMIFELKSRDICIKKEYWSVEN